jgi:hypothetical protein
VSAFTFNIAKGRAIELWRRVKVGDPATSGLVVVLLAATALEPSSALVDHFTLADIIAAGNLEATNTGYARKILVAVDLPAFPPPDNPQDAYLLPLPNLTWTAVQPDGTGSIGKLIVAYDPNTGGGTDAEIIPLTGHDFAVIPNGDDIVTSVDPTGFVRAGAICP